ncbi:hypothetical protein GCM10011360_11890 [Primorskyibacter flagellatus]|uniref:N-acetyltransferase domain-containing protein n=1 Tax=Primorskyibacter flagellatus TaxID=1387277 RepID=A0A917A3L0_9RHOB|nr:GNAT family N-acetyltransferase [Primorskyibacter flagellatus]GGE25103.1 hypothetical protein GCM10011360_11890 [Primorskyibacter flagellatus]
MGDLLIREAAGEADLHAVRQLCRDYRALLADRLAARPEVLAHYYDAAAYEGLLEALPETHARPDGVILVAVLDGAIVACGMTHRVGPDACEIKRVFTASSARGHGAARAIIGAAMDQARRDGYREMVLDTMVHLTEAISLYGKLGFAERAPFYTVPDGFGDIVRFYGVRL